MKPIEPSPLKVLMLVIDGLADTTVKDLGWKTPLQAAHTPTLDRLAREGAQALLYPLSPGVCPSSEVAHWAIFGYDLSSFPGRSFFHALHHGIEVGGDEALFTANPIQVVTGPEGPVKEGIFKLEPENMEYFTEKWNQVMPPGVRANYLEGDDILISVKMGSRMVCGNDPFIVGRPLRSLSPRKGWEKHPRVMRTLRLLKEALVAGERVLSNLFSGVKTKEGARLGLTVKWPSRAVFPEPWSRRHRMQAGAVVSTPCFSGMAAALGMKSLYLGSDDPYEDLATKLHEAEGLIEGGCEFVFVHTKHADEAAHTGNPSLKVKAIEDMDRAIGGSWIMNREDVLTVVTCDHSTPTWGEKGVIHGGDPVPILFRGGLTRRDALRHMDEISAARGGYGRLSGQEVMSLVKYLSMRGEYFTG